MTLDRGAFPASASPFPWPTQLLTSPTKLPLTAVHDPRREGRGGEQGSVPPNGAAAVMRLQKFGLRKGRGARESEAVGGRGRVKEDEREGKGRAGAKGGAGQEAVGRRGQKRTLAIPSRRSGGPPLNP